MANRWFLYISELAQKAQQEVTRTPENWQKFLTTASRFYKSYDFDDQLLIYIQRPDAVACADIETWNNKMHRWFQCNRLDPQRHRRQALYPERPRCF